MPAVTHHQRMRRIGHKGAALIAPGNTFASFDAAAAAGVDMIEFDVLPEPDTGRLVLAHDYADAASRAPHTLEEGLTYLARESF
jgi:glycerophosphoryl diester phosphodiesterase